MGIFSKIINVITNDHKRKQALVNQAFTKEEKHFIWDALHTHMYDQDSKGILLKSEVKHFKKVAPLFRPKK